MRLFILSTLTLALAVPAAADDFDLTHNVPLGHVWRGGPVADAASPGFVKYLRDMNGRWALNQTEDGRPAALVPGVQGNFWLPIGPDLASQKLVVEAVVKPLGSGQRMDAFVNGKKASPGAIDDSGWQTVRFDVPDGALDASGFAKVRLHFRRSTQHKGHKTAAAVRFLRVVPASAPAAPANEADVKAALRATEGDAVVLPEGAGMDYYVTPVKGMRLKGSARGGTVEVFTQIDGKKPAKLGAGATLDLALDGVAGKAVRLMLRGKGGVVKLDGGKLVGGAKKAIAPKKPKYVVFWLIDTLRADKLAFYDIPNANKRPKVQTPNLSAFAKEATVFEPFWVQGNESKASHASLFTGTYPARHGVYTHEAKLSSKHTTLAEAFQKAGHRTAGFVSNGYVSEKWNFAQGFKDFTNFIREGKANNAKAIMKAAKPWIEKHKDKPFYLYLGTSDPHVTYRAHKQFIAQYDKGEYTGSYKRYLSGTELGRLKGKKKPPRERDRQRIEALYENEIAFNDFYFGQLIEQLKAAGIYDETMIVVSSDHGDEFWERGSCGHGHNLNQELVNVPLIVRFPGVFPGGKRVRQGADGVDLLPTVLELLGQKRPKDVQGESLLGRVGTENGYPHALIASQGKGTYALQAGPAKVIMRSEKSITAYDVGRDPAELDDCFTKQPVLVSAAMDPLAIFLSRAEEWRKAEMGPPNNLRAPLR